MDSNVIYQQNCRKLNVERRNGLIVNTSSGAACETRQILLLLNLSTEVVTREVIEANRLKYGLSQGEIEANAVANRTGDQAMLTEAKERLKFLKERLSSFERLQRQMEKKGGPISEQQHPTVVAQVSHPSEEPKVSVSQDLPKRKRGRPPKNPQAAPKPLLGAKKAKPIQSEAGPNDWQSIQAAAATDPEFYAELELMREREMDRLTNDIVDEDDDFEV